MFRLRVIIIFTIHPGLRSQRNENIGAGAECLHFFAIHEGLSHKDFQFMGQSGICIEERIVS